MGNLSSVEPLPKQHAHLSFRLQPHWTLDVGIWFVLFALWSGYFRGNCDWYVMILCSLAIFIIVCCLWLWYHRIDERRLLNILVLMESALAASFLISKYFSGLFRQHFIIWVVGLLVIMSGAFGWQIMVNIEHLRQPREGNLTEISRQYYAP